MTEPCRSCGATVEVGDLFCKHCGSKFDWNDSNTITINKNININKRYEDVADCKRVDSNERIEMEKLRQQEQDKRRSAIGAVLGICIPFLFAILCFAFAVLYENFYENAKITMPASYYSYTDVDYSEVASDFTAMGFTNVTYNEIADLKYNSPRINVVTEISINGDKNFEEGDSFDKNSTVIITYHTDRKPSENETIVTSDYLDYRSRHYSQVVLELQTMGFTNISTVALGDLINGWIYDENTIDEITINGNSNFKDGDIFPQDSSVVITYHSFHKKPSETEAQIKADAKDYENRDYTQVVADFQAMGFTNIQTVALGDLITGWINKENTVDKITINGKSNFKEGDIFSKDAPIVISYHSK